MDNSADKNYPSVSVRRIGYDVFNPAYKSPTIAAHKALIELSVLGTALPDGFLIHHIDLDKQNASLDNLVVLTERQHRIAHSAWGDLAKYDGRDLYWTPAELRELHEANVLLIRRRAVCLQPLREVQI